MNKASNLELAINPELRTAVVYSIDELGHYLIEIRYQQEKAYIKSQQEPLVFKNLADVRAAAKANGAEVAILALSKTYEELDVTTDPAISIQPKELFDILPLALDE